MSLRAKLATRPPGYRLTLGRVLAVYVGLMLVTVLAALDQTIVATATPSIVGDIGGLGVYSWVFTSYMLATAATVLIYGKLGDLHGRRRVLLISIALFVAGSALCAVAPSMPALIAFRVLQGIGAGGLIPMSVATIASIVPLRQRGKFDGFIGAGYALGSIAGPLVGGFFVDHTTWRWIFLVNVPFGALAFGVIRVTAPRDDERHAHSLDWRGAAALAGATAAFLLGLVWAGRDYAWSSGRVLGAFGLAAVAAAAVVRIERRASEPIVPFGLLRSRQVAASLVCVAFGGMAMFAAIAYLPLFAQGVLGATAVVSGFALIPLMLGHAAASMATGFVISHTGRLRPNALAGPVVLICGALLLWRLGPQSSIGEAARAMAVMGVGIGLMNQVFLLGIQNTVPRRLLGTASALVQYGRVIGGSVGVALVGTIVNSRLPPDSRLVSSPIANEGISTGDRSILADALRPGFLAIAAAAAVVFVVAAWGIREVALRRSVDDDVELPVCAAGSREQERRVRAS